MTTFSKYQRRFYIGLVLVFAFAVVSYHLSFKRAIHEYQESKRLENLSVDIENLDDQILYWKSLNLELDNSFGNINNIDNFQENLLNELGYLCDSLKLILVDFSEPFKGIERSYEVETIILKIQGPFHPLLKLVHHIENSFAGGSISSVHFELQKNYKKNIEELFLTLYVQKIKKVENETN